LDPSQPFILDFAPLEAERFPMLELARSAMRTGGTAPAAYNAANEVAVAAFLAEKIPFLSIARVVEQTLTRLDHAEAPDLLTVIARDQEARRMATSLLTGS
jgi:1-deoxy-D-xylulose-5-phosphate reductoisomerase